MFFVLPMRYIIMRHIGLPTIFIKSLLFTGSPFSVQPDSSKLSQLYLSGWIYGIAIVIASVFCISTALQLKSKEYSQIIAMGQYNITKIIDGLFISDHIVPLDIPFLKGNKIICALGWTTDQYIHYCEQDDIKGMVLSKNIAQLKFPHFNELQQSFQFLEVVHEEMLCGLIYSETELQAALIAIMYLMYKFHWDCNTAFSFVKGKIGMFEFSDEAIDGLEHFEEQLMKYYTKQLTHIVWDYQFLTNYRSQFDEEVLIINTVKNKLRPNLLATEPKCSKKEQRVKWFDQIRPSSAVKIGLSKNVRRASINKVKSTINMQQGQPQNSADLQLLYQSVGSRNLNLKPVPRKPQKQNVVQEDFEFMQLKQMSRTNFNDRKYMTSKLRRKGSLKPKPKNNNSLNQLVGIYSSTTKPTNRPASSKITGLVRSSSGGQFWNSLRNYSKMAFQNA